MSITTTLAEVNFDAWDGLDFYVDDDATSVYVCKGRCNYRIVFGVTR